MGPIKRVAAQEAEAGGGRVMGRISEWPCSARNNERCVGPHQKNPLPGAVPSIQGGGLQ